ncbi:phosphodiester glycosidase family protein [Paenibacillus sp. PL2-23]|uniref:phosphodiester glycosidase family protein n=1 Tax=Paenibacillus sp. PL2-23 TaxID=2100729 RepID=UPI0030FCE667
MRMGMKGLRQTLLLLLSYVLIMAVLQPAPQQVRASSSSPAIALATAADLEQLRTNPAGHYRLAADIALSGTFQPISAFSGTLDGAGHVISGLTVAGGASQPKAAFIIDNYGLIENIGFTDVDVTSLDTNSSYWAAGIAARNLGTIREAFVTGEVSGGYRSAGVAVSNTGTIRHVYADASVSAKVESGGLVAVSEAGSRLEGSYVVPDVQSADNNTGGITAYAYTGAVIRDNAVLAGTIVSGGSNIGRIVGRLNGTPTLENNIASVSALVQGAAASGGTLSNKHGQNATDAALGDPSIYEGTLGWDYSKRWRISAVLDRPVLRSVPEQHAIELSTAADLEQLRTSPDLDYVLTADIALSGMFQPIASFSGTLDGDGHIITGLTVAGSASLPKAAFIVDNYGVIERIGFRQVDSTSLDTSSIYWASGIAARNLGTIREAFVTGDVSGGYRSAAIAVSNSGTIRHVYTDASVHAKVESGGLVAVSEAGSLLEGSYVVPDVESAGNNTGGITAYAYTGAVIRDNVVLAGTIKNGGTNIGRIVGRMNGTPTLANNFASVGALVQGSPVTGGTTSNAQGMDASASTLDRPWFYEETLGWNFSAVWRWSAALDHPGLRSVPEQQAIQLSTAADLEQLRTNPGGDYVLSADIELNGMFQPIPSFNGTLDGNGHVISGLHAAGSVSQPKAAFVVDNYGVIERIGFSNVAVTSLDTNSTYWAAGIAARNLGTIREAFVTGTVSGGYRSAGVAVSNTGTIRHVYADASVSARVESGGLVAVSEAGSRLIGSYVVPDVQSEENNTGGITAYAYTGAVIQGNAVLAGTIDNVGGNIGRIVGRLNGTPTLASNIASVNALVQGAAATGGAAGNGQGADAADGSLVAQATYESALNWDFRHIWVLDKEEGRPQLQSLPQAGTAYKPIILSVLRDQSVTVAPGVVHRQMDFVDRYGHLQKANIIDVDLTRPDVSIIVGVKDNQIPPTDANGNYIRIEDSEGHDSIKATVAEQAATTHISGKKVVAGVNGEFYTEQGPEGYMIKDGSSVINGVRISGVDGKSYPLHGFFGIKDDGTPVIGTYDEDWEGVRDDLYQASGGQYWLVKDGGVQDFRGKVISSPSHPDYDEQTYYRHNDRHPRTAVGIRSDGSVFFVVVDGRGAGGSTGFYIEELGRYMKELGAYQALNMDGGGSSTAATLNSSGGYDINNTPINKVDGVNTPGVPREVFSSLLVVVDEP